MTYWDPLRKKEVAATPEEKVRQWCIGVLRDSCSVPEHMMMSETGFVSGRKRYRADILIYGRDASPLAVVECKAPEVKLDEDVCRQALRYDSVLNLKLIILTNGLVTYAFARHSDRFLPLDGIPDYEKMLCL